MFSVTPEARQTAIASIRRKVDSVDAAHRRLDSLFVEVAEPPPRTQSLHRLASVGEATPMDEMSHSYYHIAGTARRPSAGTMASPLSDNRSWRVQDAATETTLGSIRLSDTESYL